MKYQIGVAGLAVMGRGLARTWQSIGFAVAGYNRSSEPTEIFVEAGKAAGYTVTGCATLEEFCSVLEKPRKILLMVKAGAAVDAVLKGLMPTWSPATSSLTAATPTIPTRSAATTPARRRTSTSWAWVSPAARKAPVTARP